MDLRPCHLTPLKPALDRWAQALQLNTAMQLSGVGQGECRSLYTVCTQAAFCWPLLMLETGTLTLDVYECASINC